MLSCSENEDPEISNIPFIEFHKITYSKGNGIPINYDTIKVSFYVTDGDFDLGLELPVVEPFHWKWYYLKTTNTRISNLRVESGEYKINQLISYKDRHLSIYDTLPKFETPYDCTNWEIKRNTNFEPTDTVYFQSNENYYNIFIDIYEFDQNQNWTLFDWSIFKYPGCYSTFNGRFAPPNKIDFPYPLKIENISRNKILMTYSLSSRIWFYYFKPKVKFKVRIKDRALNDSNEIETPEVLIQ